MEVRVSTTIKRSVHEVFEYVSDPHNDPAWISGIVSAEVLTGTPVSRGTQVKRIAKFLGKSIEYILEIADYQPDKLIAMRSVKAPFPMEVDYALHEAPGGTEFQIRVGGDTGGFYRLANPIMELQVRRSLTKDAAAIKSILEHQQP